MQNVWGSLGSIHGPQTAARNGVKNKKSKRVKEENTVSSNLDVLTVKTFTRFKIHGLKKMSKCFAYNDLC